MLLGLFPFTEEYIVEIVVVFEQVEASNGFSQFLGYYVVTYVPMVKLIIEVVAAAVTSRRHDQIVALFAHYDPDDASAGLKHVFLDAAFA